VLASNLIRVTSKTPGLLDRFEPLFLSWMNNAIWIENGKRDDRGVGAEGF